MRAEMYTEHWWYLVAITALFIGLSSRLDVYRRIKWMEDYQGEVEIQKIDSKKKVDESTASSRGGCEKGKSKNSE